MSTSAPPENDSTLPIRLISILFIIQIVGISLIVLYYLSRVSVDAWQAIELGMAFSLEDDSALVDFALTLFYLAPLTILLTIATVGVLFLWSGGWIVGMLAQCATLLICITFYIFHPLLVIYPLMIWAIFMVLVLNLNYVRRRLLRQRDEDQLLMLGGTTNN